MKNAKVYYSPEIYKFLYEEAKKMKLSDTLRKQFGDSKLIGQIESELTRMMSLSPKYLQLKVQGMNSCAVEQNFISKQEAGLLNEFLIAYSEKDEVLGNKALNNILQSLSNSKLFNLIISALKSLGLSSGNSNSEVSNYSWQEDLGAGIGTIVGALVGWLIAGAPGASIGAAAGGFFGKVIGALLKKVFGKKGFMAGPNGEDCQPPFLPFPDPF